MDTSKIRSGLQDLIIRLQDAEKGMREVAEATSDVKLKDWLNSYAKERHEFHKTLEEESKKLGGDPEVKTSFLGELHRMFIDIRFNHISDDIDGIVNEIERGATTLIEDYQSVINDCEMSADLRTILENQKSQIQRELAHLKELRDPVPA